MEKNIVTNEMFIFMKENTIWIIPIIIAVIGGIFSLIKKTGTSTRQNISNVHNSKITQIGGSQNIVK